MKQKYKITLKFVGNPCKLSWGTIRNTSWHARRTTSWTVHRGCMMGISPKVVPCHHEWNKTALHVRSGKKWQSRITLKSICLPFFMNNLGQQLCIIRRTHNYGSVPEKHGHQCPNLCTNATKRHNQSVPGRLKKNTNNNIKWYMKLLPMSILYRWSCGFLVAKPTYNERRLGCLLMTKNMSFITRHVHLYKNIQ